MFSVFFVCHKKRTTNFSFFNNEITERMDRIWNLKMVFENTWIEKFDHKFFAVAVFRYFLLFSYEQSAIFYRHCHLPPVHPLNCFIEEARVTIKTKLLLGGERFCSAEFRSTLYLSFSIVIRDFEPSLKSGAPKTTDWPFCAWHLTPRNISITHGLQTRRNNCNPLATLPRSEYAAGREYDFSFLWIRYRAPSRPSRKIPIRETSCHRNLVPFGQRF